MEAGSPPPKKFRTQPSASKVMATVFWGSKGIILIDYKPAGTSMTGDYYANVNKQLRVAIKEKRRGKLAAGILLLHDNAPVHKSGVAQAAIRECKFEQLNTRHTVQTWPQVIIICFEIWSPSCVERDSRRWFQGCYRGLVWGPNGRFLFQRHRLLKRTVCQMHWSKGGLCWKIMLKPSSNLWVKPRVLRTYWTPLVYAIVLTKTYHYMPQVLGKVAQSDARSTERGLDPLVQPFVEHFQSGPEGPMLYCFVLTDLKSSLLTYSLTILRPLSPIGWCKQDSCHWMAKGWALSTSDTLYIECLKLLACRGRSL